MFVQIDVDFFGFGGCSELDTDCSILQLGGLYTFIASDLCPERCLISMSSNPELNKIVHDVTFPEWFVMLRPSKNNNSFSVSDNKIISSLLHVNYIITTHTCNVT